MSGRPDVALLLRVHSSAGRVKRLEAMSRVEGAGRVVEKGISAVGRVIVAGRVGVKSLVRRRVANGRLPKDVG
jgi:hypothetical protein